MLIPCLDARARTLFTLGSKMNWSKICWRRASERGVGGLKEGFSGNGCDDLYQLPEEDAYNGKRRRTTEPPSQFRRSARLYCLPVVANHCSYDGSSRVSRLLVSALGSGSGSAFS